MIEWIFEGTAMTAKTVVALDPPYRVGVQYEVVIQPHDRAAFERAWNRGSREIMYTYGARAARNVGGWRGLLVNDVRPEWPTVPGLYNFRDDEYGDGTVEFEWSADRKICFELANGVYVDLPYEEWRH